tara:strand:+ start:8708 stop:9913 length:1206 start_codon:yes stop_codon:yes gene_type:complete
MAPMIQIDSIESNNMAFPNAFLYNTSSILFTNFLILLFNIIFFCSYILIKKKKLSRELKNPLKDTTYSTPLQILVLFIVSVLIFLSNYEYIINEIVSSLYSKSEGTLAIILIKKKVLFFIPFAGVVIAYRYLKSKNRITTNTLISFLLFSLMIILLFVLKNPLTEKRNALGPIYITLIYLFYPKIINTNAKFFLFLFLSMVIAFPLISSITHLDASLSELITNPNVFVDRLIESGSILRAFNTLNYDAFANIMATVDYTELHSLSFGYHLFGALFFFVPRNIWVSKPITTGKEIGNHLIENFNFGDGHFNNLSNSMVSEGYFNFGILGVILLSILLAVTIIKFLNWYRSGDPLKEIIAFYFSVHLIFLLRGDLTNGIAYFVGPLIGVYVIPKLIGKLLKKW